MTDKNKLNRLLNSTSAGAIAKALDAKDGTVDNQISGSVWNDFVEGKGGKQIGENGSISVFNAMNSITTYAVRNGQAQGTSANEVANEWLTQNQAPAPAGGSQNPSQAGGAQAPAESASASSADEADNQPADDQTNAKEAKANEMSLRPTNNKNFYYSESEKEHYKWDAKKQTFIKYPDIAYVAADGSYRREYKNADGSRRRINHNKDGYPTEMSARDNNGRIYIKRDYAAKKLGLRETFATKSSGIYYDEKTKGHYKWDNDKHVFIYMGKNVKYVSPDGTPLNYVPEAKPISHKYTGKVTGIIEKHTDKEFTYDTNGNKTKEVYKDKKGSKTRTIERTYDAKGHVTSLVKRHSNGKAESKEIYTYDQNGNVIGSTIWNYDKNGHVKESFEYTYAEKGIITNRVHKDARGNEIK